MAVFTKIYSKKSLIFFQKNSPSTQNLQFFFCISGYFKIYNLGSLFLNFKLIYIYTLFLKQKLGLVANALVICDNKQLNTYFYALSKQNPHNFICSGGDSYKLGIFSKIKQTGVGLGLKSLPTSVFFINYSFFTQDSLGILKDLFSLNVPILGLFCLPLKKKKSFNSIKSFIKNQNLRLLGCYCSYLEILFKFF